MRKVRIIAGLAVFVAVVFSWLWIFTLFNRLRIHLKRDQYRVETFEVADAVNLSVRRGFRPYGLSGTVAGRNERLRPTLPATFKSDKAEDLLSLFPRGSAIPVLYDPDAPEMIIQGETLRVLHLTPDFWSRENRLRIKYLCFVLLPVPLTLAFYRFVGKSRQNLR
jgi:hypothetical protein